MYCKNLCLICEISLIFFLFIGKIPYFCRVISNIEQRDKIRKKIWQINFTLKKEQEKKSRSASE